MTATRRTACPRCKKPIGVPAGATRIRCPHCQAALAVPAPKPTDAPTIDVKSDLVDSSSEAPGEASGLGFLQPPKRDDEIGRLGKFRILRELGRGGMGMVFLAEDSLLERKVALKVMLPEHAARGTARTRFLQEARTAAKIDHDHVVAILEIGEDGGVPYLTMPLLQGESLADRLKRERKLPLEDVLRIGAEVARGLSAAHERGLVHRDLKPGNTWLEARSGGQRAKILDFGLARAVEGDVHLTGSGQILGTPAYMSPEQARSPKVDHRSDLFTLGVMLYQMATGRLPFSGHDAMSMLLAITTEAPPPPREMDPTLPEIFEGLVMRLMEKKPDQRPRSASDVAREMEEMRLAWYPPTGTLGGSLTAEPSAFAFDETSAVVSAPAVASPTKTPSSTKGPSSPVAPKGTKPPPKPVWPWLVGVAALIVTVIVGAQIVIRITDEKGKVREIPLQPGEKVEIVQKPVKPVVPKPPEPKAPVSPTTPLAGFDPDNPAWQKAFEALPTDEQTKRVEAELRKKNPQFDGTVQFDAKDGKVTGITVERGFSLGDIGPVRALRHLGSFSYSGTVGSYSDQGALKDLSPLTGLPLKTFVASNSSVIDLTPLIGARFSGMLSVGPNEVTDKCAEN